MSLRARLGDTSHIRGPIEENRPLRDLVWFKVGGPAEILYQPADEAYALGLFHNCGIPLMIKRFPNYMAVVEQAYANCQARIVHLKAA